MQALIFYLLLPFIYGISLLPLWVLYAISDGLAFVLRRVVRYRRAVIYENLRRSFPEKTDAERAAIAWEFYRHFSDLLLESLKLLTISRRALKRRVTFGDLSIFTEALARKQSLLMVLGHYGNWEWGGAAFPLYHELPFYVLYKRLANPYFDRLILHSRARTGAHFIEIGQTLRQMLAHRQAGLTTVTAFIADQTAADPAHWVTFLNQDTSVYTGTAKVARKFGYPVVFIDVQPGIRRGHYHITADLIIPNPADYTEEEISAIHTRRLEQQIQARPAYWLWSHKRWKYTRVRLPDGSLVSRFASEVVDRDN